MSPSARLGRFPSLLAPGLHLVALTAFVVAEPLFGVLQSNPEFFVAHRTSAGELVTLAFALVLGLPAAWMLLAVLADLVRRGAAVSVGAAGIGVLAAAFALQVLKRLSDPPAAVAFALAGTAGVLVAFLYLRHHALRVFLSVLAIGAVAFPVLFLGRPAIRKLLQPERVVAAAIPVARPAPVVLVVFDQFPTASLIGPDGRIEAAAYPSFAALASRGTWYRNATTVNPVTGWATPAIVTGRRPHRRELPVSWDHPRSLFTLLGGTYGMHVSEPITDLCPESLCPSTGDTTPARAAKMLADLSIVYLHLVLPGEVAARLPSITQDWKDFAAAHDWQGRWRARRDDGRDRQWREFVDGIRRDERPVLHYIHVLLPHDPYVYLPSGDRYTSEQSMPGLSTAYVWSTDEWAVAQGYQRHLLQAAFADRLLGELLARLKAEGVYDESLIVVTADHGAGFRPGGPMRNVDPQEFAAIMAVPLLVKRPLDDGGVVSDRNVETIDILPTIAAVLGVELPWPVDGVSVDAPPRPYKELSYERVRVTRRFEPSMLGNVLALARRKADLFGTPAAPFRPLVRAPAPALIGRAVAELPVGGPQVPSSSAAVDGAEAFRAVAPATAFVPAHVTGRVRWTGPPDRLPLAVAVNGVIRATTRSLARAADGWSAWSAMLPADVFVAGANNVALYAIDERGSQGRLLAEAGGGAGPGAGVGDVAR